MTTPLPNGYEAVTVPKGAEIMPYLIDHRTPAEGGVTKCHLMRIGSPKTLCGIKDHPTGGGTPMTITIKWPKQPDPDNYLCAKCKKAALKLFTPCIPRSN